jgi:drug/metabolite transporter (DMT)-like permease
MFAFLLGSVACDVVGQVCFKLGVCDDKAPARGGVSGFVLGLLRSPWIALGVVVYALEFVFWFGALSVAPLSIAIPFAALSYCGVVVASRLILREHISPRRWAATMVVAAGVAIVCWPTA